MNNQDEIQGQRVFIANDLTKQNVSVSKRCTYIFINIFFITQRYNYDIVSF